MPWWMYIVGGVFILIAFGLTLFFWILEDETVNGETDPYQSKPQPDEQGRDDWRTSR